MAELKEFLRKIIVSLLTLEARAVVKKYKPHIVLVTGSVGKTSSKDAVYTALASSNFVRKSEKSFNSDIGVPLTILGLPNGWSNPFIWLKNLFEGLSLLWIKAPYPAWLVLEVGADRPGDITRSLSWLAPKAVVATRFPDIPVHVEFYHSPEDVVAEELAPTTWLSPGGVLVLNADDERARRASASSGVSRITYGFSADADVKASRYHVSVKNKMPAGISFDVSYNHERAHISLKNVIGKTHVQSVMAGVAAAVGVGVPLSEAAHAFESHETPSGRMRIILGRNNSMLIDDSYNSSPIASEEALSALSDCPRTGKRIVVLGDMLELGPHSLPEHRRIGPLAAVSADLLVTVGVRARDIAKSAREAGMSQEHVIECNHAEDAVAVLPSLIGEGDIVLIKGSQSMRMERVTRALMKEPDRAHELLVRHDAEWIKR